MIDSWTCHVCGDLRPDVFISVRRHDKSEEYGMTPGTFMENIRYCNDKESCIEGSNTHSHFKKKKVLKDPRPTISPEYLRGPKTKNNIMKAKYIYTFLIFFAIVMVLNSYLGVLLKEGSTFMENLLYPTGIFLRVLIASYFSYSYAGKIFKDK
jgi:hypothetical protein